MTPRDSIYCDDADDSRIFKQESEAEEVKIDINEIGCISDIYDEELLNGKNENKMLDKSISMKKEPFEHFE